MTATGGMSSVLYIPKLSVQGGNYYWYYLAQGPDPCLTTAIEMGHKSAARHFSDAAGKKK